MPEMLVGNEISSCRQPREIQKRANLLAKIGEIEKQNRLFCIPTSHYRLRKREC